MHQYFYVTAILVILAGILFPQLRPRHLSFVSVAHLDVTKCIALHNEIVRLGYEAMGNDPKDYHPKTWTEHWGDSARKAQRELSHDLNAFLNGAHIIPNYEWNFHYYAADIMSPYYGENMDLYGMWAGIDHSCGYEVTWAEVYEGSQDRLKHRKLGRYVRLYWATNIASHQEGLIFDLERNTALMAMSIHDTNGFCKPDRLKWRPLEDVLAAWLDMIKIGKIKGVGENAEYRPWDIVPYTDRQVDEAVMVFHKLVSAIETRMPNTSDSAEQSDVSTFLINEQSLKQSLFPKGFAYDFLSRARKPNFDFIAPGLALPTPSTVATQPFFEIIKTLPDNHREDFQGPPLLLFRSPLAYNRRTPRFEYDFLAEDPLGWPFNLSSFPAGLYIHAVTRFTSNPHHDQISLVLPYAIGGNGWARKSDGTGFGENVMDEMPSMTDVHAELYQPGHNPYIEGHHVRLVKVLQSWVGMVERGDWKIGAKGVESGIEEWKKADTRGGWEKYVLEADW